MDKARDLLLQVLGAIGYSGDKEKFIAEFLQNIHLQALLDLAEFLSPAKQNEIKQDVANNQNDPQQMANVLQKYFSQDQLQKALENAAKMGMERYVQTITPTLSSQQKENLAKIFRPQ